jgi:hypothetical protein
VLLKRGAEIDAARRYLAGVESLAREGRTSNDLRVLLAALEVLQRLALGVAR